MIGDTFIGRHGSEGSSLMPQFDVLCRSLFLNWTKVPHYCLTFYKPVCIKTPLWQLILMRKSDATIETKGNTI